MREDGWRFSAWVWLRVKLGQVAQKLQQSKLLFDLERFHDDKTVPGKSGQP